MDLSSVRSVSGTIAFVTVAQAIYLRLIEDPLARIGLSAFLVIEAVIFLGTRIGRVRAAEAQKIPVLGADSKPLISQLSVPLWSSEELRWPIAVATFALTTLLFVLWFNGLLLKI
jgi:hypothetical protein